MSYKPTDTFISSNANGYFSDDSSGAAKSYKVSITKPTRYPGEETTNGIIWLLDLDAFSKLPRNLNSNGQHPVQDLVGRDWDNQSEPGLRYPTKNNYYIFASIFDFPDKNPKNGSELHDPSNDVSTRDGVKLIRLDLGSSLSRVGYGELKSTYTIDELLNLVLDYMRNIYIDIIYGRRTSTKWIEAIKEESGLSREEIKKVFDDIGNLEENKVSFFIDNDKPVDTPVPTDSQSAVQNTSDSKSSELKNIIFNVQKEGIFSNAKFGELRLIGESLVNENPGFDFGDEDDLSDLLLDDEFREGQFSGVEESMLIFKEPDEKLKSEIDFDGENSIDNPSSGGEGLDNNWFDYTTKKFKTPVVEKFYQIDYIPIIDPTKMPTPKLSKKALIEVKLKVEGGLTGNPSDSAAKNGYCPTPKDGKKYHTNKGITYAVWKSVFGTSNDNRFLNMSHSDWVAVFDKLYWNKHGNSSKYESVNALIVSFAWGGSKNPTIKGAKKALGVSDLDMKSESEVVAALISARAQLFLAISQPDNKNNTFRKGWINAVNAFIKKAYNI